MRAGRAVVAATLIVVGLLYLIGETGELDASALIADWWPLVLVAFGVAQYAVDRTALFGSLVLVGVGASLLIFTTGSVGGSVWSFVLPIALVLGGIALLVPKRTGSGTTSAGEIAAFSAFGTRTITGTTDRLEGGEATVIAGGLVVDLTDTKMHHDVTLRVLAILGGCQILVPHGWAVKMSGVPLLGGWDDTTRKNGVPNGSPTLHVRSVAALAGVEVRHPARWV